jgi:hypothetical protein
MPTRKQRRRREKTFRHEYGFVMNDEEGNEIELAGSDLRANKGTPAKAKATVKTDAKGKTSRRLVRDPEPPSWRRSARRAAMWSPAIVAVSYLILRGLTVPVRIAFGVGYAVFFVPMTYWMDALAYRRFERRKLSPPRSGKPR